MTDKINGRTLDELKKMMECCYGDKEKRLCDKCPNSVKVEGYTEYICCANFDAVGEDALAYIQQLERERDAAVDEIFKTCINCKHEKLGYGVGPCPPVEEYVKMIDCSNWQWRGVQEVE